jgi:hypothetical protein
MVDHTTKRCKTIYECLVSKNMIDTEAIPGRTPRPFLLVAMACTQQINEFGISFKVLKKIGAIKARPSPFDI